MNYTSIEIELVKLNYASKGAKWCAEQLNKSKDSIFKLAKHLGIKANLSEVFLFNHSQKHAKLNVNPNLFTQIESPEIAYFLGWIWADGHIRKYKNSNTITLKIVKEDADLIKHHFLSFGKWNIYEYQYKNWKPISSIQTNNRPLADFLISKDYKNQINGANKILEIIPDHLKHYWFRGYFEGDGCLYVKNSRNQISISGPYDQNWSFLEKKLKELNIKYSISRKISAKAHKHSLVRFTSKKGCQSFLSFIYKNADTDKIYLPRKYQKSIPYISP